MWNDEKRERMQQLRQSELTGTLSEPEKSELSLLILEVESAEAASLHPATERLRRERQVTEAQNRVLQDLLQRRRTLAARMRTVLAESQAERQAIDSELTSILSGSIVADGN